MEISQVNADAIGWISETDMIEVDRVMIEDLHIELIQMMENAGRSLALVVRELASPDAKVVVAAGSGGNGGGGLVAARHLTNAGFDVSVVLTRAAEEMTPIPGHQLDILERMGVPMVDSLAGADVAVDAIIGYSLRGAPTGKSADLISETADVPLVISLDTPSGLDVTSGETPGVVVNADATMTLAAPKAGLRGVANVGDLYLADISVPPSVIERFGTSAPFPRAGVLKIV